MVRGAKHAKRADSDLIVVSATRVVSNQEDVLTLHVAPDLGAEVPTTFTVKTVGAVSFRKGAVGALGVLRVSRAITYVDVKVFKSFGTQFCDSDRVCIDVLHNQDGVHEIGLVEFDSEDVLVCCANIGSIRDEAGL